MQIMLYVDNVEKAVDFWRNLGFIIIEQQEVDGTFVVEIAPSKQAQVHFVIYDRQFIESQSPEVATNSPAIMFYTEDAIALQKKLKEQSVVVGDLIQMGEQLLFNFSDPDGNYFIVQEK